MKRVFLIYMFLVSTVSMFGQTLTDLNNEKDKILSLILENNKLLDEYSEKKSSELMQISLVDDKISKRKRLIDIYNNQIFAFNSQIQSLSSQLDSLENEIFKLKKDYSKIIYQQSINRLDKNGLIYLLSSSSFNESYRRFLFLKQYNDYRRKQFEVLKEKMASFNELKDKVTAKREQLDKLLSDVRSESSKLESELIVRQNKVVAISNQQNNLTQQIQEAEKRKLQLEQQILALIQEEAKKNKNKGEKVKLSSDIAKNKGLLPWPCQKHVIISAFGEHEHPLIPSLTVSNNGIDIDVLDNTNVTPVHSGVVSRIIMIPGNNASVIIRHGNILTVYSNLSEVNVKKDQNVSSSTVIGKVYSGSGINSNVLHFELWDGENKQNPVLWLQK